MVTFAAYLVVAYIAVRLFVWLAYSLGRDPGEVALGLLGTILYPVGAVLAWLGYAALGLVGGVVGLALIAGVVSLGSHFGVPIEALVWIGCAAFGLGLGWLASHNW
jgi:hypothetical protein